MVHMTSFCCCMGLEVGAKLVGFVHLGVSVSLTVVCALYAQAAAGVAGSVEDADGLYSSVRAVAIGVTVLSVVHVLLALTLLYSAYKRWALGLRAWVGAMCLLGAAGLLAAAASAGLHGLRGEGSDIFLAFLEGLLFYAVVAYCMLCVHSYYLVLKSSEDMEGPKDDY